MKLHKARTCKGCKFYKPQPNNPYYIPQNNKELSGTCIYGYGIEKTTEERYWQYSTFQGLLVNVKPIGQCPKPTTIKMVVEYRKMKGVAR